MEEKVRILPAGDQAVLIEFGAEINPGINRLVHAFADRAREQRVEGIGELVPSYCTILLSYDPFILSYPQVEAWVQSLLAAGPLEREAERTIKEVPVLYGGPYGPDLSFVASHNGITEEEVIRLHTSQTYLVYLIGFSPGFAAMGTVPPEIQAPRLPNPRLKVAGGSVGIAGLQTGIYAVESPGGWRLIGRTPLVLFDLKRRPPSFFKAGDYARFYAIREEEFKRRQNSEGRSQKEKDQNTGDRIQEKE